MYVMPVAVMFKNVNYTDVIHGFSCQIETGERALIVTGNEDESTVLTRLMTGFLLPEQGSIAVSGNAFENASSEQLMQTRLMLGVIPFHGGRVSNLKMWENIFLPYYYHTGKPGPGVDELASDYLKKLDCNGKHLLFPAHLSLFEQRVAAFTRAAIMHPDIMIYCNTLERISKADKERLSAVLNDFHEEKIGRTSIYLASDADLATQLNFDSVLYLHQRNNTRADS